MVTKRQRIQVLTITGLPPDIYESGIRVAVYPDPPSGEYDEKYIVRDTIDSMELSDPFPEIVSLHQLETTLPLTHNGRATLHTDLYVEVEA